MNKYLEKIAEKESQDFLPKVVAGIGLGSLGALALRNKGGRIGMRIGARKQFKNVGKGLSFASLKGNDFHAEGSTEALRNAVKSLQTHYRAGKILGGAAGAAGGGAAGYALMDHMQKKANVNKYLEKIAEKKEKPDYVAGALKGAGAVGVGAVASNLGAIPVLTSLNSKPGTDKSTWKKILKDNKGLNTTFSSTKAFGGNRGAAKAFDEILSKSGPAYANDKVRASLKKFTSSKSIIDYIPGVKEWKEQAGNHFNNPMKKNYINMKSPFTGKKVGNLDIALHELGHAKDFEGKSKFVNSLKQTSYRLSSRAHKMGLGAMAGGLMLQNDKTKDYAWTAPIITAAPMLRGEAAANYHGYKMLKQHGTSAMKKKFLTGVAAKNMLSYGSGVAASALALHLMKGKDTPIEKKAVYADPRKAIDTLTRRMGNKSVLAGRIIGGLTGGATGAALSQGKVTEQKDFKTVERDTTREEKLWGTAAGAVAGAFLGGNTARDLSKVKTMKKILQPGSRYSRNFDQTINRARNKASASGSSSGPQFNDFFKYYNEQRSRGFGNPNGPKDMGTIYKDLGAPVGGFKTKAEASKHYKKMAMKHHPDRGGNPETMAKVNAAFREFKAHPQGFNKLAGLGLYLDTILGF